MRPFLRLVARFGRDESGVFAIMFGLMAVVLIAMGGAVVDYVRLEQTRNRAQIALDAAALALQHEIFENVSDDDIKADAEKLMLERIGDSSVKASIELIRTNIDEGSLYFEADMTVPTLFVGLVGVHQLNARIVSEATRKKLELEVVMVLDNSGSMANEGRMTNLINAAKCATYTLFYDSVVDSGSNASTCVQAAGAKLLDNVKVGIVPFTIFVNVGTANKGATWIDQDGKSSIANDNFDTTGPVNRLGLFTALNEQWRGCVEARPHTKSGTLPTAYLDTDDTAPSTATPDTLFVPMISTDLPETIIALSQGQNYLSDTPAACKMTGTCTVQTTQNRCDSNYAGCQATSTTRTLVGNNVGSQASGTCTCSTAATYTYSTTGTSNNRFNRVGTQNCNYKYDPQGLTSRQLQERLCKYTGSPLITGFSQGPNADCTRTAILPLTDKPASVISTIGAMQAAGGTNIHEGTAWGFRTLSPDEPFAEGAPYDEGTSKVMIVMTDGENTAYNLNGTPVQNSIRALNGSIWYSAYGWPYNQRLGVLGTSNADLVTEMNTRTSQTCENAKAAGITVYTIGLATSKVTQSTQAVVEDMLKRCATSTSHAYFPQQSSELKTVFASIAAQLAALRLAQ